MFHLLEQEKEMAVNSDYNNYSEEWKSCRDTADRFDEILHDLRKYGFSILTGLTTAGSFLGFAGPSIIYVVCDRSRTSTVISTSNMIKKYRLSRHDPVEVEKLEEQMMDLFE